MATADGALVVAFNGEIYNYLELREQLSSCGHQFRTSSDTEVLLHGYREWGVELPCRLIGMFSMALADRQRNELFLARDRFGEKPLLYSERGDSVAFASELGPLATLSTRRELDGEALADYLCLNYVPGEATLMKGVRRLRPGSWRLYTDQGPPRSGTFWDRPRADDVPPLVTLDAAVEKLEALLDRSVELALRSDVPVGIFLSGGIDSSLVALSAARSGQLHRAYCLTFEEEEFSEWPNAERIARSLGIPITRVVLSPAALDGFLDVVDHADDPLADSSALAVWTLAREAARTSKVVLGGDGADELFGGYLTYKATLLHQMTVARLPLPLRCALAWVGERLPTREGKVSTSYKLMRFLRAAHLPPGQAHFAWNGTWLPQRAGGLLKAPELSAVAEGSLARLSEHHNLSSHLELRHLQRADAGEYLANDILVKVDRMSMAHGLEVRAPFLEPQLAEFALRLPAALKVTTRSSTKTVLRALASRAYGLGIARAPKQGFSIPIHTWLRGPARERLSDLLSPQSVAEVGVLEPLAVQEAVDAHLAGRRSYGFELWGLMVLVAWHRARIARAPSPADTDGVESLSFRLQGAA